MQEHALRAQDHFRARLSRAWRWSEVEARDARLKRLQFDVVVKTFCDWMNAFFVPTPAPSLTAFNNFKALNWKNVSLALMC